MSTQKQAEEAIVSNFTEEDQMGSLNKDEDREGGGGVGEEDQSLFSVKSFLWHGGSAWDAWFSCASNQVAQVLLTLPYSFSQLGMLSGIVLQVFYGILGSWTAYLISVLYIEYRSRKEKEGVSFKNHVIQKISVEERTPATPIKMQPLLYCTSNKRLEDHRGFPGGHSDAQVSHKHKKKKITLLAVCKAV